jgi:hypothetical protein
MVCSPMHLFERGTGKSITLLGSKKVHSAWECMNLRTTMSSTRGSTVGSVVGSTVGTYDVFHWEWMLHTNFGGS